MTKMKATYIYGIMAAGSLALATACSDNINADLEPVETTRVLDVTVDGEKLHALDLKASPSEIPVEVHSNTRWKVEVTNCDGGWCSVNVIDGSGDGSFTITTLDNMREVRDCDVTVYMTDAAGEKNPNGSWGIKVTQEVSNVRITPSSVEPFAALNPRTQEFSIISNVDWTLSVSDESGNPADYVTLLPVSGITSSGDGKFAGSSGAVFNLTLQDNRRAAARKAYLTLQSAVSTYLVEINQNAADFTFDVSPLETQIVPAEGKPIEFGIYSPNSDWYIESSVGLDSWITFSAAAGQKSDNSVVTVATVAPNNTLSERTANIVFKATDGQYGSLPVTIIQRGFDLTFTISSPNGAAIVKKEGGSLGFDLDSRFDWIVETPSWISANPRQGNRSESSVAIDLTVDSNGTNNDRTATVTVYPQPTLFGGVVTIDPASLGIEPMRYYVTQSGGKEPAISVPWLRDGYTQTSATVEFNFYSPFHAIVEAGLEWGKEGSAERYTMKLTPASPTDATVSFDLTGLDPATKYVARGYVRYGNEEPKYGEWSFPFTTAGQYPGSGDNPTPSK